MKISDINKRYLDEAGIYKIVNSTNNRVYIGSGKVIKKRYQAHSGSYASNKRLQKDIKKHTIDNFYFDIIEVVDRTFFKNNKQLLEYLFEREQVYLDIYFAQEYINNKDKRFHRLTYNLSPIAKTAVTFGNSTSKNKKAIKAWEKSGLIYKFYKIDKNLNIEGPFSNLREYCRNNPVFDRPGITQCFTNKSNTYKGFVFTKESNLKNKLEEINKTLNYWNSNVRNSNSEYYKIEIKNTLTNNIEEFKTVIKASKFIKCGVNYLHKCIRKNKNFIKDCEIISVKKLNKAA